MSRERYEPLMATINRHVDGFNLFLDPSRYIRRLETHHPDTSSWIEDGSWAGVTWPSKDSYGVYFLAGHRVDRPDEFGLYIGKASFGHRIGHRLWTHLKHGKQSHRYLKQAPDGTQFAIQMLFALPMPTDDMRPFAPALEEHLIHCLRSEVYLLNRVGNK